MSLVLDQPHLIDTMRFKVFVQRRLAQDEVNIKVQVTTLVKTVDRDRTALAARIGEALRSVIQTEWAFSRIERTSDATGYERVSLHASTRVDAVENYDLEERCRRASREGLSISHPAVGYALSLAKVDAIMGELMEEIVAKAAVQASAYSEKTGRAWRIGDIEFGTVDFASTAARTGKGAYRDESSVGDLLAELDVNPSSGLASAERIWLLANVTLKSAAG
jgi:hypothetical protein